MNSNDITHIIKKIHFNHYLCMFDINSKTPKNVGELVIGRNVISNSTGSLPNKKIILFIYSGNHHKYTPYYIGVSQNLQSDFENTDSPNWEMYKYFDAMCMDGDIKIQWLDVDHLSDDDANALKEFYIDEHDPIFNGLV